MRHGQRQRVATDPAGEIRDRVEGGIPSRAIPGDRLAGRLLQRVAVKYIDAARANLPLTTARRRNVACSHAAAARGGEAPRRNLVRAVSAAVSVATRRPASASVC
jgi:hypothetical protein